MIEKRPRQYLAEILPLKTREERMRALGKVPEHLQQWVKGLVEDAFKHGKRRQEAAAQAKEQNNKRNRSK